MTFLHWIGDAIREQLLQVPLWGARCLFIGLLLALMGVGRATSGITGDATRPTL